MEEQYNYNYGESQKQIDSEAYSYEEPSMYKRKRKPPKWIKVIGLGILFGIAASVTFQAGNMVMEKVFHKAPKSNVVVENTELAVNSNSTVTSDVSEIVKNTMPSVVSITNLSVQQVQNFFGGIQEYESESAGSGFVVAQNSEELLIVTNNHVVEGSESLTVTFIDQESVEANVKGTDAARDLAVIAVSIDDIKEATLEAIAVARLGDSSKLQVGEPAIAIGNALGYGQSVTTGIISALNRELDGIEGVLIQTDAAINPGNSGGALLNANGEVIGINSAKIAVETVEGIGYAIPVSEASEIIQELMNQKTKKKVAEKDQGMLGIQGRDVTEELSMMYGMPQGVYVAEVTRGSGAKKAGITKGMIITGIEGTKVDSLAGLQEQLRYYRAGEEVEVTVQVPSEGENYKEEVITVVLGKKV